MAYTADNAIKTLLSYMKLTENDVKMIPKTARRGLLLDCEGEEIVIFVYPISCKKDNRQNFFDTRDSGAKERKIAWDYAIKNGLKYYCFGVNSDQERYRDYILSLESPEKRISDVSFRKSEENVGTGTQVNIPANYIPIRDFERICTPYNFYISFIRKEKIFEYIRYYDNRPSSDDYDLTQNTSEDVDKAKCTTEVDDSKNIILYGVPGCGKSHAIKTQYCDDEAAMERIVFHPDYTNSDFIGQILPQNINGNITYKFIPGPFTRIMKKAYQNPDIMHYLVIEEINRGNAPAIFGEVFQLLDRKNGESEYGISNPDIAREIFLNEEDKNDPGKVKEAEEETIKIPENLTVLATMNTADQNVFTLDTAFKRRWSMRCIPNDFSNCLFKDIEIGNTTIRWSVFATEINKAISNISLSSVSSEDKRLGAYFVSESELRSNRKFAEKVLAYLWDDVFKFDRNKIFRDDIQLLDKLVDEFEKCGLDAFNAEMKKTLLDYNNPVPAII